LVEKNEDDQFPLKVTKKEKLTHDTYLFELEFPNQEWISGLWVGAHFVFHCEVGGKKINRKYTPITPINTKGRSQFVIKVYRNTPEFPEGGIFSQHLENNVHVGDSLMCEGPIGRLRYLGGGDFKLLKNPVAGKRTKIGLIAGGTGITPMFSIAQASSLA
jgi:cytochrome-b5 reductase